MFVRSSQADACAQFFKGKGEQNWKRLITWAIDPYLLEVTASSREETALCAADGRLHNRLRFPRADTYMKNISYKWSFCGSGFRLGSMAMVGASIRH